MIDFHMHSTASDGSFTPSELVRMAADKSLEAIALTDHDTVSGVEEFLAEASRLGIPVLSGVEVSVSHETSIHIVGLFVSSTCGRLNELLREIRRNRDSRNILIVEKLNSMGYLIGIEELEAEAKGESAGRPHIAKILISKGYFKHPQDVFDKCLKKGTPAYCPRILPEPSVAIDAIHEAGGLAVWAHPLHRADSSIKDIERTLASFIKMGLDGIEAYYSTFTNEQQNLIMDLAARHGILISGGSDFHGTNMRDIEMGVGYGGLKIPFSVYEKLLSCHHGRKKGLD